MSFVLPGNNRQLRFTGEARALKDETGGTPGAAVALGKPRVRKPTTPAPIAPKPATSRPPRHPSLTPASPGMDESSASSSSYRPPQRPNRIDPRDRSWDGDEQQTMAFDREGAEVLPGGAHLRSTRSPGPLGAAPIPHFRPANGAVQTVIVPNQGDAEARSKGAPLALWIFAAILAGILSYHVTPAIMSHFEAPPPTRAGG